MDSSVSDPRRRPQRRVVRLDGVRAIAALSVLCFHVWLYRTERPHGRRSELLDQVFFHASGGLICFFVLSGYLLYGPFARAALTRGPAVAIGPYARRRAARIVPAYWVCGAGCLILYRAVGYHAITPAAHELPAFALFLHNYSLATMGDLNPVMWTLGVEVAFYATLPLVAWAALRLVPPRLGPQLALVGALIAVTPVWDVVVLENGGDALLTRALPAYLGSFGLGMLVAVWAQSGAAGGAARRRLGPGLTAGLIAVAAIVLIGDAMWEENGWWLRDGIFRDGVLRPRVQATLVGHLWVASAFALLIAGAACGSGPAVRWLGWRPLAAIGTVSYGLYLWHLPLLLVMDRAGVLPAPLVARLVVVLAVSLAAAAASWRFVERPWIERRADRRSAGLPQPRPSRPAAEPAG
jgi:peptidoglycan/LPS O-acetylase OafA/YrhL